MAHKKGAGSVALHDLVWKIIMGFAILKLNFWHVLDPNFAMKHLRFFCHFQVAS